MKEPRRLLTDTKTSELSRSLLAAGRARREPEGARERVWDAVSAGLASSGVGTASGSAALGGALASGGAKSAGIALASTRMKLLALGSVIAVAASLTVVALMENKPATAPNAVLAPVPMTAPTDAKPVEAKPALLETTPPLAEAKPTATVEAKHALRPAMLTRTPSEPEAPRPVASSGLREEAALLQEARAALARGDTGLARAKLGDARARFPGGQLGEERAALEVRLANDSGDRARAAAMARAFVERYPDSPLRAGVETIARAPENQ